MIIDLIFVHKLDDFYRSNIGLSLLTYRRVVVSFRSYFPGFRNKDVAFLHMPSKSLIEADLLLNLPAREQASRQLLQVITYGADHTSSIRNHPLRPAVPSSQTRGSTGL